MRQRVTASPNFPDLYTADGIFLPSINGKPAKTTWARGDAQFIGRGTPHESKNTGGKPTDFVIVAVK